MEGELIGGINRNKKQMVVQFPFFRILFFIALLIDKQRGRRRRKKQERKLVYKLFNWFAFALACFFLLFSTISTYNEIEVTR